MKLSPNGFMLIQEFEKLMLTPYYATADEKERGIVSIGYGNTFYENGTKVAITDPPITKTQALRLLQLVADKFAVKVNDLIQVALNQNQFDALVSLAYNIGLGNFANSTLLKIVNHNPTDENITHWFMVWNKQSGKVLDGLTRRRKKEAELYFK